ncbi:MAG TPA: hypothetical protein VHO69_04635, partial [Phototrophicaceae bacterium]|nr:hypothetical protein [Phototrophicaceae bacterium]
TDGYWIIRNSWGTSWYQAGQWSYGGYFKVGYGECNIDRTLMAWAMQPIPAPTPLSPENNISTTDPAVTFSWSSSNSPLQVGYNLRIGTNSNPNGTSWLVNTTTTNTNYSYTFATGGTYYWHIRTATDPVNGTSSGWVTRSFIINATPPANNDFANAPIIDFPYIHTADTRWATTQSGEKTPSCGYNDGKSVWYKYVAPYNDTLTFNTWGSNFNTVLSVWRGTSLSGLTEVVCDSYQSGVSFAVTSGTTYYIRVSGWNKAAGDVVLNGTSSAVPDVAGLIQAIEQANFDGYGTIYLKPNTTYALTSAYSGQNGLPVITSNISIYGGNATISRAAAAPFRLFEVAPGTHLYLQEVTLINGVADNGGAILNHGNLALFRTTITQNHATYNGGGINGDSGSSSTISSSKFENNSAQYGGGLDSWGQVYASLTEFKNNTASTSGGGIGVGSDGRIDLYNCRFENNQAIEDGGGINTFGSVSDTGSTFIGNRATNGGAMHTGLSSSVTLNGSFVRANLASGWGGGLRNWGAMTINRALISDNQAGTGVGGGIASSSGWLTLTHSVLSNNIAVWGGAIYNDNGWLSAENTHLRYNFATYGAALYNNIPVQVGMGAQAVSETSSDELAQPRVPVSQPEPTRPGADSGNMSAQGGGGAKEVFLAVNILIGNNYASLGGGIYNHSGKITLADARIESNSASNGGGISAYADSTIILGSSQVYNNTATFAGGGIENWGLLTVTNSSFNRNQTWISSSGGGAIMNYGNLDVTSAWFTDNHSENNGGAIFSSGSSTIAWTTFQGNSTYYDGGAIWNSGAASLTDSTIKQNIAGYNGGGIANHNAPLTITGGTFDHNHASYKGGGLYLTTAGFGIGTLNSAQFKYNSANEGGAVFADGSSLAMDSSCLVANSHTAVMGSSTWITAQNNWWGAADGPSGFGAGSGDSVNDSVDYTNFSGIPFGNCAPSNDDFDHAYPIRQLPYSFTQSTVNALDTADDPRPLSCTSQISANTVWYAYTPEYNNRYRIDTIGSSYDTLISIWTGTRGHLTAVGCNNNISSGNQASLLEFNATANRTYYIMVSGVNNQSGLQTISVTSAASAAPGLNLSNNRAFELSWGHLSWAIAYEVQLDRSSAFTTYTDYPIGVLPREQFSVTTPELENGVYYWRVRAQKPDGNWSGWSAVGTFTINAP